MTRFFKTSNNIGSIIKESIFEEKNTKSFESIIEDNIFDHVKTKTLLRGEEPRAFEKDAMIRVLKYFAQKNPTEDLSKCIMSNCQSSDNSVNYDNLIKHIKDCDNAECLMLNAAKIFHIKPRSLLMLTTAICTRVMPYPSKTEWFDNYTLNSYLYQLTTIVDKKFDKPELFSVDVRPIINKSEPLINPCKMLDYYGNAFRCFMEFGKDSKDIVNPKEATDKMDALMEKYVYSTGCAHGCDCFRIPMGGTIEEIAAMCRRYPKNLFGYILNTSTYESGNGKHWVMVMFRGKTMYYICSFGKDQSGLMDSRYITEKLSEQGISIEYNMLKLQEDNYNCGLFSVLSTLAFILEAGHSTESKINISKVVARIGRNARNINKDGVDAIRLAIVGVN